MNEGPGVVELRASREIQLEVFPHRRSRIQVEVETKSQADADYKLLCVTKPADGFPEISSLSASSDGQVIWKLIVHDSEHGGPTGDPPYAPELRIEDYNGPITQDAIISPKVRFPWFVDYLRVSKQNPLPQCGRRDVEVRSYLEEASASGSVPTTLRPTSTEVRWFEAGSRLYLGLHEIDGAGRHPIQQASIKGVVLAKEAIDLQFAPVCSFEAGQGVSPRYFMAEIPWEPSSSPTIWRVDVERTDAAPPLVEMDGLREAGSVDPSWEGDSGPDLNWIENVCLNLAPTNSSLLAPSTPAPLTQEFANEVFFAVKVVVDDPKFKSTAKDALAASLTRSLSTWRRLCVGCDPLNFAVLDFGDRLAIDSTLYDYFNAVARGEAPSDPVVAVAALHRVPSDGLASGLPKIGYVLAFKNDVAINAFCSTNPGKLPASLSDLRASPLCGGKSDQRQPFVFEFLNRRTSCSSGEDVVACNNDNRLIQLNALDYTFDYGGAISVGSGQKAVDLNLVILHEVGHWLGLCHMNSDEGVMNDHLSKLRCIDQTAWDALLGGTAAACPANQKLLY